MLGEASCSWLQNPPPQTDDKQQSDDYREQHGLYEKSPNNKQMRIITLCREKLSRCPDRLGSLLTEVRSRLPAQAFGPDATGRTFTFSALRGDAVLQLDVIKACALLGAESNGFVTDSVADTNDHDHSCCANDNDSC
jgi:hypothetical protein